jgi:hypothetical protein
MKLRELTLLAVILVIASAAVYTMHYFFFRDAHHIFIFLLGDIAFVFLEVLLVGLVIERLLTRRERAAKLHKLNMVTGVFFNEVGTHLLEMCMECMPRREEVCACFTISGSWTHADFKHMQQSLERLDARASCGNINLEQLKEFLSRKRSFLLQLLTSSSVLEHERGSDILWAVFHLADELQARENLGNLPASDIEHLNGDIQRIYQLLAVEWLTYMEHLKTYYPFLFSLAARTHRFQPNPTPLVK